VEVVARGHAVLQTQSRDLLNNRLHDKLDTNFHRRGQGSNEGSDKDGNFFLALLGHD